MAGNMRRNIEITNDQVDHVSKVIQVAISRGPVFDDFDNTVEAFANGIGQVSIDESEDVLEVISQCADKLAQRGNTASQRGSYPAFEELLRRGAIAVIPEVLELILEHPGTMDATIGVTQAIEKAGISFGAISGVHTQQPTQSLDRLTAIGIESTPLFLSHLVHGLIQCLHDMEAVDDKRGIGTVVLDRLGVGATHVATGPQNARFLPLAQAFVEEAINGLAALSPAYPKDMRTIKVINEGGKLATLAEGDLINAEGDQTTDFMPFAHTCNDPVQQVRQRRGWHFQDLGSCFLSHDLAQGTDAPLQPVGYPRIGRCPWDRLLRPPVGRALNLLGCIPEQDLHAHESEILPSAKLGRMTHNPATSPTFWAAAAVLIWLDRQMQLLVTIFEPNTGDFHALQA